MIERRFVRGAEVRAKGDGHIEGHAAVFNQEYVLWDSPSLRIVETIKPGTFTRALDEQHDVRCLFNHNPDNLLGRTAAKTLKLEQNDRGLAFDCAMPDTSMGRDTRTSIARGDVSGCSFAFTVTKQARSEEEKAGKTLIRREIQDVDLYDVGPVTYPAYEGTDVKSRSRVLELRSAFPDRIEFREPKDVDDDAGEEQECRCQCRACYSAECDECEMHMADCGDDERCNHAMRSIKRGDAPTRRVDSEDLTASCYIYVGDPAKPETWALPWKFKSVAKIKSHLRNALARFNQTQKIPSDKKAAAWKKLVRLAKKYGIAVSDDESKSLGLSAEQRKSLRSDSCDCICPDCLNGNCEDCSDVNCDDENCDHGDRSGRMTQEHAKARAKALAASISL